MFIYRRILKISWTDRTTNQEVLNRMYKKKKIELLLITQERKLNYYGHIHHNEKYYSVKLVLQGQIIGKRNVGRSKLQWRAKQT